MVELNIKVIETDSDVTIEMEGCVSNIGLEELILATSKALLENNDCKEFDLEIPLITILAERFNYDIFELINAQKH